MSTSDETGDETNRSWSSTNRKKDTSRRISFKTYQYSHVSQKCNMEMSIRTHLSNEEMSGLSTSQVRPLNRGNTRGSRSEHRNRRSSLSTKKLLPGRSDFYEVMIPYMQDYDKKFILNQLYSRLPSDALFHPLYFKLSEGKATFYVDSFSIAKKILQLHKVILLPNGYSMMMRVRSRLPEISLNNNLREKMIAAFARRYNPDMNSLDLSSFHLDPELSDVFSALARPDILNEAITIIASKVPSLVALNLDNNKIYQTDHLICIPEKLPHIKVLHLKNNNLTHSRRLEPLKKLSLVELMLDGNPFKNRLRDYSVYVRIVRKMFPKILKLDGTEIPPEITFELQKPIHLPTPKAYFFCNSAAEDTVRLFLYQYYTIYDSGDRQCLEAAYKENSIMSLSVLVNTESSDYKKDIINDDESNKTLMLGCLQIVSYLILLPKTQHDITSFQVDMSFLAPTLMLLSVSGVFKELNGENNPPIRSFHRVMTIVPAGSGLCIKNEQLYITSATSSQKEEAFRVSPIHIAEVTEQGTPAVTGDITKLNMLHVLAANTNMNLAWSEKCMEDNHWELERALCAFNQLKGENKIPLEAFIK
ncbi:nuclear RNA export factor 1-like [Ctenocephalides felis]|uniref:nuclear RNA export factor 1-like n=1 Tax=Ctenocephalides felis TaxID=7515 RepID=UPI000E6E12BF|nr:nuclear RNA export factor 1-like [Ctenocephalides felis]